jgi:hypothetical protein
MDPMSQVRRLDHVGITDGYRLVGGIAHYALTATVTATWL